VIDVFSSSFFTSVLQCSLSTTPALPMPPKTVSNKAAKAPKVAKMDKQSVTPDSIIVESDELAPSSPQLPPSPQPDISSSNTEKNNMPNKDYEDCEDEAPVITADGPRITWSLEMLEALIEFILECHRDGKTSGGGMKKELWHLAAIRVNRVACGFTVPWDKCKNKLGSDIKEKWKHWVMLSEMSGFGFNEEKELYEAFDYVWDNLNKAHPRIIWHKTHVMYYREELSEILHGAQATGQGAVAGIDLTGDYASVSNHLVLGSRLIQIDANTRATATASASSSPVPQSCPKTCNRSKKRVKVEVSDDEEASDGNGLDENGSSWIST
jgi:hypothetical protein